MRNALLTIATLALTAAVTVFVTKWYLTGKASDRAARQAAAVVKVEKDMQAIYAQVARDALGQYNIVSKHGSPMDRCVYAGLVSAAYVQAKDNEGYKKWKDMESIECRLSELEFETEFEKKIMGIR